MTRVTKAQMAERLATRPPTYMSEIAPALVRNLANGDFEFDEQHPAWRAAIARYRPLRAPAGLIQPAGEWPLWARGIRQFRHADDAGVGDTVHRQLNVAGEAFKATMKLLGAPCGCDQRRAEWNARFPYAHS